MLQQWFNNDSTMFQQWFNNNSTMIQQWSNNDSTMSIVERWLTTYAVSRTSPRLFAGSAGPDQPDHLLHRRFQRLRQHRRGHTRAQAHGQRYRVACPNFGHSAQTSSFTKYNIFAGEKTLNNSEWTASLEIVSAFEWCSIIFVACLQHLQSAYT